MPRLDPMIANNLTVSAFAAEHRLRTKRLDDGEVVIPCGPRKANIHLGFGLRPGKWYLCACDLSTRQSSAIRDRLSAFVTYVQLGDAEFVADISAFGIPAQNPLPVADSHPWTSPRRIGRHAPPSADARARGLRAANLAQGR